MTPLKTPILFLIFNRPDTTQIVFNEIRKAQPAQLFVAADGPRKERSEDYRAQVKRPGKLSSRWIGTAGSPLFFGMKILDVNMR